MNDYITIGEIVRAQGIRGEIKVRPLTDDPERFYRLKVVYISDVPYASPIYASTGSCT